MTAVVGPVPSIRFRDGARVAYDRPRNTLDPRWDACTDHRPACDCREAELAEEIAELRGELEAIRRVAREVLADHPTFAWENGPYGERNVGCRCRGCVIARETAILRVDEVGPSARDEVDGLSYMELECGWRWRVCAHPRGDQPCSKVVTRDRGLYHEHKVTPVGSLEWLPEHEPEEEVPF